jgi:hypothetical protein
LVDVETFSGVTIRCEIVAVRQLASCASYTVKPREDREVELKRAGVPRGEWQSHFTAFDWQVKTVQPELKVAPQTAVQGVRVVRKVRRDEGYIST